MRVDNSLTQADMEGERPREPRINQPIKTKWRASVPASRMKMNKDFPIRKRPVHMPIVERSNVQSIIFVTLTTLPRGKFLDNKDMFETFKKASCIADAWSIGYFILMPDHIHLFCTPATCPRIGIKIWVAFLKRQMSLQMDKAKPWKWQPDFWDTQI